MQIKNHLSSVTNALNTTNRTEGQLKDGIPTRPISLNQREIQKLVDQIFFKMNLAYGQRWLKDFTCEQQKDDAKKLWCYALRQFSPHKIQHGIKTLLTPASNPYKSWPPTVYEFAELCNHNYKAPAQPEVKKIEKTLTPGELEKIAIDTANTYSLSKNFRINVLRHRFKFSDEKIAMLMNLPVEEVTHVHKSVEADREIQKSA